MNKQELKEHRSKLREHLFKMVFLLEFNPEEEMSEQVRMYLEEPADTSENDFYLELPDEDRYVLNERFEDLKGHLADIDLCLNVTSNGWKTQRMGKVDLAILRLGVYEVCFDEHIPEAVAIDEAVELAKRFGGTESSAFVNGILGQISRDLKHADS